MFFFLSLVFSCHLLRTLCPRSQACLCLLWWSGSCGEPSEVMLVCSLHARLCCIFVYILETFDLSNIFISVWGCPFYSLLCFSSCIKRVILMRLMICHVFDCHLLFGCFILLMKVFFTYVYTAPVLVSIDESNGHQARTPRLGTMLYHLLVHLCINNDTQSDKKKCQFSVSLSEDCD